ncbi:DNA glycosylase [Agrocybe pediades]|nr:DNA glycosylase [Agrocybe pediades]
MQEAHILKRETTPEEVISLEGPEDEHEEEKQPTSRINPFARFAFVGSPSKTLPSPSPRPEKRKFDEASASGLPTPSKKGRSSRTKSKVKVYDHLREVEDNLAEGLDIIICGINPGKQSSEIGHHYGNPNNHFWSCLHESGLTSRKLDPREDFTLPAQFSIGLTNLTARPTIEQNELSRTEQVSGVSILLAKIHKYRPRVVCFVGLGIADIFKSEVKLESPKKPKESTEDTTRLKGKSKAKVKDKAGVGLQPFKMVHEPVEGKFNETLFFAVSSTSGRVVRYQKSDKVQQFRDLRIFVENLNAGAVDTSGISSIIYS